MLEKKYLIIFFKNVTILEEQVTKWLLTDSKYLAIVARNPILIFVSKPTRICTQAIRTTWMNTSTNY
jgi:hypothetical protein